MDEDGDLIVERRSSLSKSRSAEDVFLSELHQDIIFDRDRINNGCVDETVTEYSFQGAPITISIRHRMATPLDKVGLQVWRGAALLSEHIVQGRQVTLNDAVVLELGAGCGLVGLVAAHAGARKVYCTDIGLDVLENCQSNVDRNNARGSVTIRWLDCAGGGDARQGASDRDDLSTASTFDWTPGEFDELCKQVNVILAADVIYDDHLTAALMRTCLSILLQAAQGTCMLFALEKRDCFTIKDMDVRAPAYDFWRSLFSTSRGLRDVYSQGIATENHLCIDGAVLVGEIVEDQGNLQIWRLHVNSCLHKSQTEQVSK